jgi:DNA-binding IclR family transcriptional regulator
MVHLDERILEHLQESESPLTAWELAFDLDARTSLVRHRCRTLQHAGFLYRHPRETLDDRFALAVWGRLYLTGEVDANLRRPMPRPRPPHAVRPGWWAGFG